MKMKKRFQLTYETISKTIKSIISLYVSFEICYWANLSLPWCFVLTPLFNVLGGILYSLCHRTGCSLLSSISQDMPIVSEQQFEQQSNGSCMQQQYKQFQQEFAEEHQTIRSQRTIAEQEKLEKVLDYTRRTFTHLDFQEAEIFMVCKSVEYLVTHNTVLKSNDICIAYKPTITQISLKNFAWNVANQYQLRGLLTAEFVVTTFDKWFKESTINTVAKNLRTTTGKHTVEIDEHIC